ncbi:light-regulated signal transduction histidine kinase (bacteriophytochrome) [Rhodoblastus acidophilus]|uniref:HWE histidine kinase domain-containing protein n=1 Tax=Rhodoblastus acidophilus TaxID=1074 RepID=UPI002224F7C1|nr:HWE histidine kinase domain-containing protein [Rhodoblastus acidophilus]MCW2318735.1 light-regulated signal transduction histidine kinase (bacteriophytochrome) [Rhodoblastus acidophilus]
MTLRSVDLGEAELTSCDREPIQSPGAIQPHGVMLVINRADLAIKHFAGDTQFLLGVERHRMAQLTLFSLFMDRDLLPILERLRIRANLVAPSIVLGLNTRAGSLPLDATLHAIGDVAIIELEPSRRSTLAYGDALAEAKNMIAALHRSSELEAFCKIAAAEVRGATGFDRVMVYQFLHDGSGKVLTEDKAEGIEAFVGLHYPASDIPRQARTLYKRNWLRMIPNVNYAPAPLEPPLPSSSALDMSDCVLRSVSPIHLQYLRNMGVAASMSISIVIGDELWGLIACHHYTERYIAADLRIACEMFGQIFSLQLESKIDAVASKSRAAARRVQQGLISRLVQTGDVVADLIHDSPSLFDLVHADGVAVLVGDVLRTAGGVPPDDFIRQLAMWLKESEQPMLATFELGAAYPAAKRHAKQASGLLALSISRQSGDYVFWFRQEAVQLVTWAGNPGKTAIAPPGESLTPRASFDAWKEERRGQSRPWEPVEIEAAQAFRVWLLETVLHQLELANKEREATLAHQSMLMCELDHRVKNALAKIQALIQQTKIGAGSVDEFALALESRIRALAHAHNLMAATHWQGANLGELIEGEIAPYRTASNVTVRGDDVTLTPQAASSLTLVIHELSTNAAKYGALSTPEGRLAIEWRRDALSGALILNWTERGGPRVSPPSRAGFGSVVIKRSLAHELTGSATLSFEPEGVVCVLSLPAQCVLEKASKTDRA